MGEVYRARDTRLERTVAIKVLPTHLSSSPEVRQRFEREARTISQLSHPHICALHDIGRDGETDYLVLEYLEGETLAHRLARGPIPLPQALRFGREIAEALEKAHRQGIVHRDLKPGNVMLTKSGVKLLDFGLAKVIAPSSAGSVPATAMPTADADVTKEGTILGTFQYMAPEQLEGKDADTRTDIFALGTVLYEMATGRKAFSGTSRASLISAIMKEDPAPISKLQPLSPPTLDHIVSTCLAKEPEDRWQSAGDVAKELAFISGTSSQAGAATPMSARPRRRANLLPWVAAGMLLLASLWLANEVRRLRAGPTRQATYSFLIPPDKTKFHLTGDDAAGIVLSPDGERAVYGAGGKLWVHSLRSGKAASLAGTEAARSAFWSPDSRFIGFFSDGKLRTIEATGGPVQTICDAPNPRGGSWGSRGMIVFAPDVSTGVVKVSASGGTPEPVTRVDEGVHTTHRWPAFLPDGEHFLYVAANHARPRSADTAVFVVSMDGKDPRRVVSTLASAQYVRGRLLFVRETSLMVQPFDPKTLALSGEPVRVADDVNFDTGVWRGVFTASENGVLVYQQARSGIGGQLSWVDDAGRMLKTVGERSEAYAPRLSPDGHRAAVMLGDPNNDIWVYDLDRGTRARLTTDARVQASPVWSPDGSEIFYASQRPSNDYLLSVTRSDGAGKPRVVAVSKERLEPTDWSPDGRHVLIDRGNIGVTDVWVYPIAEPAKAYPLIQGASWESSGQFSPDGRWIAYRSMESGRAEVYVTPFSGEGARWQISTEGGTAPRWSPDERTLYFFSLQQQFMAASVGGRGSKFQVGETRPLFQMNVFVGPRIGIPGYDVAPDGKRFLVNSAGEAGEARVVLVTNWDAGLPK
jgi:Tol biopolymer transport system component